MFNFDNLFNEGIVTRDVSKILQASYDYEKLLCQEIMLDSEDHYDLREDISTYETCAW